MVQPERDGLALEKDQRHMTSLRLNQGYHLWNITLIIGGLWHMMSVGVYHFSNKVMFFAVVLWPVCCHATNAGHDIQPVTVHKQGTNLSFCYTLNVTLEYDVLGLTWPRNPFPTFHTRSKHSMLLNVVVAFSSSFSVRSPVESVPYLQVLEPETCGVRMHYAIRSPTILQPSTHTSKCSTLWWW